MVEKSEVAGASNVEHPQTLGLAVAEAVEVGRHVVMRVVEAACHVVLSAIEPKTCPLLCYHRSLVL